MKEIGLSQEELATMEEISDLSDGLVPTEESAFEYIKKGKKNKAYDLLYSESYNKTTKKIADLIDEYQVTLKARMQEKVDKQNTEFLTMVAIVSMFVTIIFVLQFLFVRFILKELIAPIKKIEKKMIELSNGDISTEFDVEIDTTEVGTVARAVKTFQQFQNEIIYDIDYLLTEMADGNFNIRTRCEEKYVGEYNHILLSMRNLNRTLNSALKEIDVAAEQLTIGVEQISLGALSLSQGSTEQAASVEELTATIGNVSSQINEIADNAKVASEYSKEAEETVNECSNKMCIMNNAMKEIGEKSAEINSIIKTIDDIAFQTNILALNAAVEAARAGEAGKGFAVVADEVRNLANKTASAAQNTTGLISESVEAVEYGKSIASETTEILNDVVKKSTETLSVVNNITEASERQAVAVEEVVIGMDQINTVVQSNSATAEESAAASEELNGQANMMKELVDKFAFRDE